MLATFVFRGVVERNGKWCRTVPQMIPDQTANDLQKWTVNDPKRKNRMG